ncbi:hypothetical protein LTR36_010403 [Oleoguttula mirabilis]|uniref:Uncharacterized protein n=1 Tax=Oleoguttula mirabilis TaxID=1507867 RepID=A0AAV9J4A6_9PEZI|nr:hypothetical protein LTR36_010403 [Oleoguttula mirabilis]
MSRREQKAELLARAYEKVLIRIHLDNPAVPAVPAEIAAQILRYLGVGIPAPQQAPLTPPSASISREHLALSPPRNGSSPFMALPSELRRSIFATSLSERETVVLPTCNDEHQPKQAADETAKPPRNRTSDLMVINMVICREIATVVYEERTFTIHVHEGIKNGGIEFLNVGRQPLQYKDNISDRRFVKFRQGEDFGFDRLKKIRIDIYPSDEDNRLISMNTYYMNLALVALLERADGDDKKKMNRITSLTICFVSKRAGGAEKQGRRVIMNAETYWWDAVSNTPRMTSIHETSNVELVLLPFSRLRSHNVRIELPPKLNSHAGTLAFVNRLENTIKGSTLADMMDDRFQHLLEAGREAYDEHVTKTLYGNKKYRHVPKLSEADMQEDEQDAAKHDLSPNTKRAGGNMKRHKRGDEDEDEGEDEDGMARLPFQGEFAVTDADEDEQLQLALARSLQTQHQQRARPPPTLGSFASPGRQLGSGREPPRNFLAGRGSFAGRGLSEGLGSSAGQGSSAAQGSFTGQGHVMGGTTAWARSIGDESMSARYHRRLLPGTVTSTYLASSVDGAGDAESEKSRDG